MFNESLHPRIAKGLPGAGHFDTKAGPIAPRPVDLKPDPAYRAALRADLESRIDRMNGQAPEVLTQMAKRPFDDPFWKTAKHVELYSSREDMLKVMESGMNFSVDHAGPLAAGEWAAARAFGGNVNVPKTVGVLPTLSEGELGAFWARSEVVQATLREKHGDTFDVFRGLKGKQADAATDATSLQVGGLSSWSTSQEQAATFAGKSGTVITTPIKTDDVFLSSDLLKPGSGQIVLLSDKPQVPILTVGDKLANANDPYRLPGIADMRKQLEAKGVSTSHISPKRTLLEQRTMLKKLADEQPAPGVEKLGSGPAKVVDQPPTAAEKKSLEALTIYHGTSSEAVESIMKQGLVPKAGEGTVFARGYATQDFYAGDRALSVYLTENKDMAYGYGRFATMARGGDPVVLTIKVPAASKHLLVPDEQGSGLRFKGKVEPDWITAPEAKTPGGVKAVVIADPKAPEQPPPLTAGQKAAATKAARKKIAATDGPIAPVEPVPVSSLTAGQKAAATKAANKTAAIESALATKASKQAAASEASLPGALTRSKTGWQHADGQAADAPTETRIKALRVPPAWTDVKVSADPESGLQAIGRDVKGRSQYIYSAAHTQKMAAEKFSRQGDFSQAVPGLRKKFDQDLVNKNLPAQEREAAAVLVLIHKTGFRIGSDSETGAAVKAFGASTLLAKHVKIDGDNVNFKFIGKKGVEITKTVKADPELVKILEPRVKAGGRLFDTSDSAVRDYLHSRDGQFKVKDFRTWHGTSLARREVESRPVPANASQFKTAQLEVSKIVAAHLGNTPAIAKASYIDPAVWSKWLKFSKP